MPKNIELKINILDWFINWWKEDAKHTVCLLVLINKELYFIERELENDYS